MPEYPIPDDILAAIELPDSERERLAAKALRLGVSAIPDEAVALATEYFGGDRATAERIARSLLAAAAPHIAAAALRQAADDLGGVANQAGTASYGLDVGIIDDRLDAAWQVAAWLRKSADDLGGRQPTPDTPEAVRARLDALRPDGVTP